MKILITGGFGYLGGRVAQFLANEVGNEILLGSRNHIQSPFWLPQSKVVQTQWDSSSALEKICAGIDVIIHTAGMNAQDCAQNPVAALEFNGSTTDRLVKAAASQGVRRFIYISTAHVYKNPLEGVITEETPLENQHPYATSHRAGEDAVRAAHEQGKIEGVVVRLSNAFGAPAHKDVNCWMLLVNDLCRQAVTTRKMILRSSGLQRRDFITIRDACRAIQHLIKLPADHLGEGLFNIGGNWSPTVWDVASLIQERCQLIFGFQPELTSASPQKNDLVSELDYKIEPLRQSGFQLRSNKTEEIDRLLEFCKVFK